MEFLKDGVNLQRMTKFYHYLFLFTLFGDHIKSIRYLADHFQNSLLYYPGSVENQKAQYGTAFLQMAIGCSDF